MRRVKLKIFLIQACMMALGLAIYEVWFRQPYIGSLEAQGSQIGIGEIALGYFGAICIISFISWFMTKNMGDVME